MLIKWLILLVALTAHFWLWGQWSFDESIRSTGLLSVGSVLFLIMLALPIRALINKTNPKKVMGKLWFQIIFYLYVLIIVLLSVFSFTGLIKILLPIKVALILIYAIVKFKLKKSFSGKKRTS